VQYTLTLLDFQPRQKGLLMETGPKASGQNCKSCRFVLLSDSSHSGLRCGWEYFQKPPTQRKAERMSHFAELEPISWCGKWMPRGAAGFLSRIKQQASSLFKQRGG
jgi:hypothetical protein